VHLDRAAAQMTGSGGTDQLRLCLFGAPTGSSTEGGTGNLGVSALGISTVVALADRLSDAHMTVFDHGRGVRRASIELADRSIAFERRGAWLSWRLHRSESLRQMYVTSSFGRTPGPNVAAIDRSAAVLDLSGGDSFTDLYGRRRFEAIALSKRIVLKRGRPLVLLPQTYGPFSRPATRRVAADIAGQAALAWARDADSLETLKDLLGDSYDPARHRQGVDVAFLLPTRDPGPKLGTIQRWLSPECLTVGINVSGLLYNEPDQAKQQFGLQLDYPVAVRSFIRLLLEWTDANIVLVPHTAGSSLQSDARACALVAEEIARPDRLAVLPSGMDAPEVKWVISRFQWFSGTRMHATIAALSSGVPASAIAYSDKTRGVFRTCDVGDEVIDARAMSSGDLVDALWDGWTRREAVRAALARSLPHVIARARGQFDELVRILDLT
jgi:colanic acid/amylovoran biosynthesis protein